jgi:hypothetical protein
MSEYMRRNNADIDSIISDSIDSHPLLWVKNRQRIKRFLNNVCCLLLTKHIIVDIKLSGSFPLSSMSSPFLSSADSSSLSSDPWTTPNAHVIMNFISNFWSSFSVRAFAKLQIADRFCSCETDNKTKSESMLALSAVEFICLNGLSNWNVDNLDRLFHHVSLLGLLSTVHSPSSPSRFSLTPTGRLLCINHPSCLHSLVLAELSSANVESHLILSDLIENFHGFMDKANQHKAKIRMDPELAWQAVGNKAYTAKLFTSSMTALTTYEIEPILSNPRVQRILNQAACFVDIGGSSGSFANSVQSICAHLKSQAYVFDLSYLAQHQLTYPNIHFCEGSFFSAESLHQISPPSLCVDLLTSLSSCVHIVYHMKHILHDWNDANCIRILNALTAAIMNSLSDNHSKVCVHCLITEHFIDLERESSFAVASSLDRSFMQFTRGMDIHMCVVDGKQRSVDQVLKLFQQASNKWKLKEFIRTGGPVDVVHFSLDFSTDQSIINPDSFEAFTTPTVRIE